MKTALLLFTQTYPYEAAQEHMFIEPELPYLAEVFSPVIVVPQHRNGCRRDPPAGVMVDETHSEYRRHTTRRQRRLLMLRLLPAARLLLPAPRLLTHSGAIDRLYAFLLEAATTAAWIRRGVERGSLPGGPAVYYSYWLDTQALGLCLARKTLARCLLVSRAHGYDIYPERHPSGFIPGQRAMLSRLDRVFTASCAGRDYLKGVHPEWSGRIELATMGTPDPGFRSRPSTDAGLRIASCSGLVPVKRVELIAEGILHAARLQPERAFHWDHFGDGPSRAELDVRLHRSSPANLRWHLHGQVPNNEVFRFYRTNPVDLFMNCSRSEGLPIALQEAAGCGIPLAATDVGGNREIVSGRNGHLLDPNPSPGQVGAAIVELAARAGFSSTLRQASRAVWEERFDASVNHRHFALRLERMHHC